LHSKPYDITDTIRVDSSLPARQHSIHNKTRKNQPESINKQLLWNGDA